MNDSRNMIRLWIRSLIFAAISFGCMLAIFLKPLPQEPGYAPYVFQYNIEFFFPILFLSVGTGSAAGFYVMKLIDDWKKFEIKWKGLLIAIPIILISPMVLQFTFVLREIIIMIFE